MFAKSMNNWSIESQNVNNIQIKMLVKEGGTTPREDSWLIFVSLLSFHVNIRPPKHETINHSCSEVAYRKWKKSRYLRNVWLLRIKKIKTRTKRRYWFGDFLTFYILSNETLK